MDDFAPYVKQVAEATGRSPAQLQAEVDAAGRVLNDAPPRLMAIITLLGACARAASSLGGTPTTGLVSCAGCLEVLGATEAEILEAIRLGNVAFCEIRSAG